MGDLVLRGGLVVDGDPEVQPRIADVRIAGGRIAAVEPPGRVSAEGAETIDCTGRVVAPGFIDIHTHSDLSRFAYPAAASRVTQGITTEVVGNCGMSPAPVTDGGERLRRLIAPVDVCPAVRLRWRSFPEYLDALDASRSAVNVACLAGHGSIRHWVLGEADRPATAAERDRIAGALAEALEAGAWGASLGLMYAPGEAADGGELRAVAGRTRERDGLLAAHLRAYDGPSLPAAVEELLTLGEGARVQVSHLRSVGPESGGVPRRALDLLHEARARGVDVAADAYPYTAGHTTALQLLSPGLRRQGLERVLERIRATPQDVEADLDGCPFPPDGITIVRTGEEPSSSCGRTLSELAGGTAAWPALLVELLDRYGGAVDVIVDGSEAADVEQTLLDPLVAIGSDGVTLDPRHSANYPHPRSFGTFPRALRLLLDRGLPLQETIARATSLPAERLRLPARGRLSGGYAADVVVLDLERLADRATYAQPTLLSAGVDEVIVGGDPVVRAGADTGTRPGRLLRRGT